MFEKSVTLIRDGAQITPDFIFDILHPSILHKHKILRRSVKYKMFESVWKRICWCYFATMEKSEFRVLIKHYFWCGKTIKENWRKAKKVLWGFCSFPWNCAQGSLNFVVITLAQRMPSARHVRMRSQLKRDGQQNPRYRVGRPPSEDTQNR